MVLQFCITSRTTSQRSCPRNCIWVPTPGSTPQLSPHPGPSPLNFKCLIPSAHGLVAYAPTPPNAMERRAGEPQRLIFGGLLFPLLSFYPSLRTNPSTPPPKKKTGPSLPPPQPRTNTASLQILHRKQQHRAHSRVPLPPASRIQGALDIEERSECPPYGGERVADKDQGAQSGFWAIMPQNLQQHQRQQQRTVFTHSLPPRTSGQGAVYLNFGYNLFAGMFFCSFFVFRSRSDHILFFFSFFLLCVNYRQGMRKDSFVVLRLRPQ